jgi:hypothetical protein
MFSLQIGIVLATADIHFSRSDVSCPVVCTNREALCNLTSLRFVTLQVILHC